MSDPTPMTLQMFREHLNPDNESEQILLYLVEQGFVEAFQQADGEILLKRTPKGHAHFGTEN